MATTSNRRPAGTPTGGQFAPSAHPESEVSLDAGDGEDRPPLADYQIVGFARKEYRAAPDAPTQPGSTCWHCGAGIINAVRVRHHSTGEEHDVGLDCAERTGLDRKALKALLAERHSEERALRSAAARSEALALRQRAEEEAEALHGPHGSEGRWLSGCRCEACVPAAPHGSLDRLEAGGCHCEACVEGAVASGLYRRQQVRVLVDAGTGEVLPARSVSTRFGRRWVLDREDGAATWFPYAPARRSTLASKGVVEAEVEHLVRPYRRGGFEAICALEAPKLDAWGEAVGAPR